MRYTIQGSPPNHSLKLTESTVDDFAARCGTIRKMGHLPRVCATMIGLLPAVSLAPVR